MHSIMRKKQQDNGEIMLESVIIITITIMLLIAMIAVGFVFYQKSMITAIATELASDIANNYKYCEQDLTDRTITENKMKKLKKYRTSFSFNKIKKNSKKKAEDYLPERVKLGNLGMGSSEAKIDSYNVKVDNIGRMHVEVTVSLESDVIFGGVLRYFHIIDDTPVFTATGRAECIDVTAYASHVRFVEYVEGKLNDGAAGNIMDGIVKTINSIKNIASKFK